METEEKFDGREAFLKMQDYWAQWHIVFKWIRDAETLREAKTIFTEKGNEKYNVEKVFKLFKEAQK